MTTGEAALLLHVSRQHVVDLCERGRLAYIKVGSHRRVSRAEIEAMLKPRMTRDQLKSLWLHRAVAGRLVAAPDAVLARATANLERLREVHPAGMTAIWLDRWRDLFRQGIEEVLEKLSSLDAEAMDLRQNSPFAGVLTEEDRLAVLTAFAAWWRTERAA